MKKHLARFVLLSLSGLTVSRACGGDDGPSLFVIPQAGHPAQPAASAAKKTSPAQPNAEKKPPAQTGIAKTVPVPAAIVKPLANVKTPYTGKITVNRPVTMPSQTMPSQIPSKQPVRSDSRRPSQSPSSSPILGGNVGDTPATSAGGPGLMGGAGSGTIGRYRARLELRRNGTFVVSGSIEGSGTWYQRGPTIVMDSPTSHYEGQLENSTISGTRTFKDRDGVEPWKFVLSERALEIRFEAQGK
jgi:hypothetical protein